MNVSQRTLAPTKKPDDCPAPVVAPSQRRGSGWWPIWRDSLADFLFPPQCVNCSSELEQSPSGPLLCQACAAEFAPSAVQCPACALPVPKLPSHDGRCAACRLDRPAFHAARALGSYDGAVRQAVLKIKHAVYEPLAMALGMLLAQRIAEFPLPSPPDLIVPVPMYWLRRLLRKMNAAQTLAEAIAGELRIGLAADLVRCRRLTARQSSLPASERRENVRGAYRVSSAYDIRGATILVVDDVITTNATCDEMARVLKLAGAERVFAVAVARAGGRV